MRFRTIVPMALLAMATCLWAQEKQPQPKSQKEVEALQAIQAATDPDSRIKAIENLLNNFADTDYKPLVLQIATQSAQQKGDWPLTVAYAERTLEADPKSYNAMLILAAGTAQHTGEHDLDKDQKLAKAEKYANDAMAAIKTAPKPRPDLPDADWENAKKDFTAQAHEALGISASVKKKHDVAITEYKQALATAATPDPTTMVRLGAAYNATNKPDEAIPLLDKVLAMGNIPPAIKTVAQSEKSKAEKLKSGSKS